MMGRVGEESDDNQAWCTPTSCCVRLGGGGSSHVTYIMTLQSIQAMV